jgi:hypothetical protein
MDVYGSRNRRIVFAKQEFTGASLPKPSSEEEQFRYDCGVNRRVYSADKKANYKKSRRAGFGCPEHQNPNRKR